MITIIAGLIMVMAGFWTLSAFAFLLYEMFRDQNFRELQAHVRGYIISPYKIITKQICPGLLILLLCAIVIKYLG